MSKISYLLILLALILSCKNGLGPEEIWRLKRWQCATENAGWSGRYGHTSVVFDNKMWVLGGGYKNDVWYSSDGINWVCATENAGWSPRDDHTSVVFDNKMWVLGGGYKNDVWYWP